MKAFMLAAGLGKRLLPLTQDKPKPLLKVGGIPLIQRNLMKLKDSNISEVVINVHYLGEQIINFLGGPGPRKYFWALGPPWEPGGGSL